jgi:hypothetical protein
MKKKGDDNSSVSQAMNQAFDDSNMYAKNLSLPPAAGASEGKNQILKDFN